MTIDLPINNYFDYSSFDSLIFQTLQNLRFSNLKAFLILKKVKKDKRTNLRLKKF